jgi:hypothetical protein
MLWHVGHTFLSITFISRSHPAHHFFYPSRPPWTKPTHSTRTACSHVVLLGAQAWSNGALRPFLLCQVWILRRRNKLMVLVSGSFRNMQGATAQHGWSILGEDVAVYMDIIWLRWTKGITPVLSEASLVLQIFDPV